MKTLARLRSLTDAILLAAAATALTAQPPGLVDRLRSASESTSLDTPGTPPRHRKLAVTLAPGTPASGAGKPSLLWPYP